MKFGFTNTASHARVQLLAILYADVPCARLVLNKNSAKITDRLMTVASEILVPAGAVNLRLVVVGRKFVEVGRIGPTSNLATSSQYIVTMLFWTLQR